MFAQQNIIFTKIGGANTLKDIFDQQIKTKPDDIVKITTETNKIIYTIKSAKNKYNWTKVLSQISNIILKDNEHGLVNVKYEILFDTKLPNSVYWVGEQKIDLTNESARISEGINCFDLSQLLNSNNDYVNSLKMYAKSNTTIKYISNMYYGSFVKPGKKADGYIDGKKVTIENTTAKLKSTGFTSSNYIINTTAFLGFLFKICNCKNLEIKNLDLDGNISNQIVGGGISDKGNQAPHVGLALYNCKNVNVEYTNAHHFGLDGVLVSSGENYNFTNCNFQYNGRQAMSWVGGNGLKAINCKFNHTGRTIVNTKEYVSSPGAGLDIEPETSAGCKNGYFQNCEFINNEGCALVNDLTLKHADLVENMQFNNCVFSDRDSYGIWIRGNNYSFNNCKINCIVYGVGFGEKKGTETTFNNCKFEDKTIDGKKFTSYFFKAFLLQASTKNMQVNNCEFTIYDSLRSPLYISHTSADGINREEEYSTFNNCNFIFKGKGSPICNPWINTSIIMGAKFKGQTNWTALNTDNTYHGFYSRNVVIEGSNDNSKPYSFSLNGNIYHIAMFEKGLNKVLIGWLEKDKSTKGFANYNISKNSYYLNHGNGVDNAMTTIGENATINNYGIFWGYYNGLLDVLGSYHAFNYSSTVLNNTNIVGKNKGAKFLMDNNALLEVKGNLICFPKNTEMNFKNFKGILNLPK